MRLILSSNDFSRPDTRQCILDHLNVPLRNCRLLYIPNEKASADITPEAVIFHDKLEIHTAIRNCHDIPAPGILYQVKLIEDRIRSRLRLPISN